MTKKNYRTMQGRDIDMEALRARNELVIAVSNESVNARGDHIKGGKIVKPRDHVVAEYYENNPNAVPKQAPVTPPPATTTNPAPVKKSRTVTRATDNKIND